LGHTLHQSRSNLDRFQHFQHDLLSRQKTDNIEIQHSSIDIHETRLAAYYIVDTQFCCMCDYRSRCRQVVHHFSRFRLRPAKQQLVSDDTFIGIQNGLPRKKEFSRTQLLILGKTMVFHAPGFLVMTRTSRLISFISEHLLLTSFMGLYLAWLSPLFLIWLNIAVRQRCIFYLIR